MRSLTRRFSLRIIALIACALSFLSSTSLAQESTLPFDLAWDDPTDTLLAKMEAAGLKYLQLTANPGDPIAIHWFLADLEYAGQPVSIVQLALPTEGSTFAYAGPSVLYLFVNESPRESIEGLFALRATLREKYGEPRVMPGSAIDCLGRALEGAADIDSAYAACDDEGYMLTWTRAEGKHAYDLVLNLLRPGMVYVSMTRFPIEAYESQLEADDAESE